jgi:transcriptional regulator with XRE-family HTH domain
MAEDSAYANRIAELRSQRNLSQSQLADAMKDASSEGLPDSRSLARQIWRWENGKQAPSRRYRKLLAAALHCSEAELGFAPLGTELAGGQALDALFADQAEELAALVARRALVSPDWLEDARQGTDRLRHLDRQGGAEHLLYQLRGHQGELEEAMSYALAPGLRGPLGALLADSAALHAWHALDMGRPARAWESFDVAEKAAAMSGDPSVKAFVAAEKAYALLDIGNAPKALDLVEHAKRAASPKVPALVRAWLSAANAELEAAMGNDAACKKLLARSAALLDAASPEPGLPFIVLDQDHWVRWRGNCLARLGDPGAISDLGQSLAVLDLSFVRARAGVLVDLATALGAAGEHGEASRRIAEARSLARQAGSARQFRRAKSLQVRYGLLSPQAA